MAPTHELTSEACKSRAHINRKWQLIISEISNITDTRHGYYTYIDHKIVTFSQAYPINSFPHVDQLGQ